MELIAIALARIAAFLEVQGIDPAGRSSTPEVFRSLGERYSFNKVPQRLEDLDLQKGVELSFGKMDNINIDKLVVFRDGIIVETRSSTEDSERVILDLLDLAHQAFGAKIGPYRKLFYSQVIFRSDMSLVAFHPMLPQIANRLSSSVSKDLDQAVNFEPVSISLHFDLTKTKMNPGHFSIERRADVPFSESTYFSQAPLRTAEHLALIQEFETSLAV